MLFTGLQLVTLGLLAEMQARTYHESQGKPTYYIRKVLDTSIDEPVAVPSPRLRVLRASTGFCFGASYSCSTRPSSGVKKERQAVSIDEHCAFATAPARPGHSQGTGPGGGWRHRTDASAAEKGTVVLRGTYTKPVHIAFLGCGFIAGVHSRHLKALRDDIASSYASRDGSKAAAYCRRYLGAGSYDSYIAAIEDPVVDAVVIAVPPRFHLDLTLQALAAAKHVLVEKPAYLRMEDYERVRAARDRAGRVVLVGENDHYKPLAVCLRRLLREGVIGEMVFAHFTSLVKRFKRGDDWRNDETMAGGDAFFEEGIHWLHLANSLGPVMTEARGFQPTVSRDGPIPAPRA